MLFYYCVEEGGIRIKECLKRSKYLADNVAKYIMDMNC